MILFKDYRDVSTQHENHESNIIIIIPNMLLPAAEEEVEALS